MQSKSLRDLKEDDSGVSPVIAVILMVAITVVLAAVVYTWASSLAETGGGGGQPGSCSQGNGNFINIEDVARVKARADLDYRMVDTQSGDVFDGVATSGSTPASDEYEYDWSGTQSSNLEGGDVFQVVEQPSGSSGTEWSDGDKFTFRVTDSQGTLVQCPFTWEE